MLICSYAARLRGGSKGREAFTSQACESITWLQAPAKLPPRRPARSGEGRHPLIQDRTIAAGVANLTHPSAGALYSTSSIQDCAQLLRLLRECTSLSSSDSSELCMEPSMSSKSLSNSSSFFFAAMIFSKRSVQRGQH